MAIKLYKSQLTPTTESSNVMNRNRVSMSEAASIGNAWKGMVRSGELLYAKHQDIKTDNEILEKSNLPFINLFLVASSNSAGKKLVFRGKEIEIEDLNNYDFSKDMNLNICNNVLLDK